MNNTENIDELISKYSYDLLSFAGKYNSSESENNDIPQQEKGSKGENEKPEIMNEEAESDEESADDENESVQTQPTDEIKEESETDDKDEEHEENLFFPRTLEEENEDLTPITNPEIVDFENPKENPENFALFTAKIFAAEGALPIEGAKIVVKKNGEIHSFLLTNGSGETKTVKLESYPEENSLEPLNPEKQMNYTADVFADGFESKTDLLVAATGGSHIILQEFMVPVDAALN